MRSRGRGPAPRRGRRAPPPRRSRAAGRSWRRPSPPRRCRPPGPSSRPPVLEPEPGRHRGQPRRRSACSGMGRWASSANGGSGSPQMAPAMRWPSQVLSATPEPLQPVAYQRPSIRPQCGRRSRVSATLPPQARSIARAGELRVHLEHRSVEEVPGLLERHAAELLATSEHHPALVVEPPVPEQVAVVEAHAPGGEHLLGQRRLERLGGDDVRPHRQHAPAEGGHDRVGVGVGGHQHVARGDVARVVRTDPRAGVTARCRSPACAGGATAAVRVPAPPARRGSGRGGAPRCARRPGRRRTPSSRSRRRGRRRATRWAGEPDRAELVAQGREPGGAAAECVEVELPGPFVRAVEAVGHQRLDVVEGILDLLVEAKPELAVPSPRACGAPPSARAAPSRRCACSPPTEVVGIEQGHRSAPRASSVAAESPAVAATDHHHVRRPGSSAGGTGCGVAVSCQSTRAW